MKCSANFINHFLVVEFFSLVARKRLLTIEIWDLRERILSTMRKISNFEAVASCVAAFFCRMK